MKRQVPPASRPRTPDPIDRALAPPVGATTKDRPACRRGYRGPALMVLSALLFAGGCAESESRSSHAERPLFDDFPSPQATSRPAPPAPPPPQYFSGATAYAHAQRVTALAVSPAGNLLASAAADRTLKLWSVADGRLLRTWTADGPTAALAITSDGQRLVSGAGQVISLWAFPSDRPRKTFLCPKGNVEALAVTPDGGQFLSALDDGTVMTWTLPACDPVADFHHPDPVTAAAATPDGTLLVTASRDGTVRSWSLGRRQQLDAWDGPRGAQLQAVARASEGPLLAGVAADGTAKVWALPGADARRTLPGGHPGAVVRVALTPDGRTAATGDEAGAIILWDLGTDARRGYLIDSEARRRYRPSPAVASPLDVATLRPEAAPRPAGAPPFVIYQTPPPLPSAAASASYGGGQGVVGLGR